MTDRRRSASAKARWADPIKREAIMEALLGAERRAKISAATTESWTDPEVREKRSAAISAARAAPEVREKIGAATKARWADPVWREKTIAVIRAAKARQNKARAAKIG